MMTLNAHHPPTKTPLIATAVIYKKRLLSKLFCTTQTYPSSESKLRRKKLLMDKGKGATGTVVGGNSPMAVRDENEDGNSTMRRAETILRLLPMALCISALVLMLKNSQTNDYGSLSYSDLGAFRYLVHANGICAGYSLLSAVMVAMPRPSTMSRAWTFFFFDQVLTYVILAAGAVSTEVMYLAEKGDMAITWSSVCASFGGFCNKATTSLILTFVVVVFYIILSLISSYKLFSRYDAPVSCSSKGIEIANFHG